MEDREIIELYWRRSERAIACSEEKYGAYCRAVARQILRSLEDTEECVSDTWLAAWNAMPPHRPAVLRTFLGRLTRNLAVNRRIYDGAQKRGGGEVTLALEELQECAGGESAEQTLETAELGRSIDRFLRTLPEEVPAPADYVPCGEIARRFGLREGAVKTRLHRTREKLRVFLRKEGYAL